MGRVERAVIQSRVYLRRPGLPRVSLANLPVWKSTCMGIYLYGNLSVESTCPETLRECSSSRAL
jgi:hypothetical protein